ncbi:MAG: HNH endonuclease [Acidobacteria bacterium]|nr:HNH endonuclease [Acidobacteriota bacterium]
MRYFTHLWSKDWLVKGEAGEGEKLDHTAGTWFRKRRVRAGDIVYAVAVREGHLHLLGRLEVAEVCSRRRAEALLGTDDLWDAPDHVVAKAGTGTPTNYSRVIPPGTVAKLRFVSARGSFIPAKFSAPGRLDHQTMRNVRELTPASARLLDSYLGRTTLGRTTDGDPDASTDEATFPEGRKVFRQHQERERNQAVVRRAKALREKQDPDLRCDACGFSFVQVYGTVGKGFVEAHHVLPLAELESTTETRVEDLALVCANCHRMLDRRRPWLSKTELRDLVRHPDETTPA